MLTGLHKRYAGWRRCRPRLQGRRLRVSDIMTPVACESTVVCTPTETYKEKNPKLHGSPPAGPYAEPSGPSRVSLIVSEVERSAQVRCSKLESSLKGFEAVVRAQVLGPLAPWLHPVRNASSATVSPGGRSIPPESSGRFGASLKPSVRGRSAHSNSRCYWNSSSSLTRRFPCEIVFVEASR